MLNANPFYFSLLRKYTSMFGSLFDNIQIQRKDDNDSTKDQLLTVPLVYSPKEKALARYISDPEANRDFAIIAPMISFELLAVQYDTQRALNKYNKVNWFDKDRNSKRQYTPVPYNLKFRLNVYIKNMEDGNKIVEQILPYFTPNLNLTAVLVEELGEAVDIPITLDSVSMDDVYDGDFRQRKIFTWTLMFTMRGYFYGPIKEAKLIRFANASIYISTSKTKNLQDESKFTVKILDTPGMTPNGQPTTHSSESISPLLINIDDDWGYCIDITEF